MNEQTCPICICSACNLHNSKFNLVKKLILPLQNVLELQESLNLHRLRIYVKEKRN